MKKTLALILVLAFAVALVAGCASTSATTAAPAATKAGETTAATTAAPTEPAATFKGQDIRVVIGSTSTTADTYMNTETAWRYLSKELGANYKVDPVGAGAAYEALATAKPDGSLVEEFHDMMYIGVMSGAFDPKYALENFVVGPRLSMNNGSCFAAKKDAPYNDMKEMAEYLKANPTVTLRLAVEAGSVSHVAFVAYYEWLVGAYGQDVADRIKVLALGSTSDKLQAMWDGNVDVIFADYNTMLQYTEEGVDAQLAAKIIACSPICRAWICRPMPASGSPSMASPSHSPKTSLSSCRKALQLPSWLNSTKQPKRSATILNSRLTWKK
ncbi:MAG: hypothetical protein LRY35_05060 [Clostridiales bacterium]|nr:hypothetical protein [Clostridiales bacterium]